MKKTKRNKITQPSIVYNEANDISDTNSQKKLENAYDVLFTDVSKIKDAIIIDTNL